MAKQGPKFMCCCPSCHNKIVIQPTQLFSTNNWSSSIHFTTDQDQPCIVAVCAVCSQDIRVTMNLSVEKIRKVPHLRLVANN